MDGEISFGTSLRRSRRARDLTQGELARLVGCAEGTIQKIEAEERRPSKDIAERLADVLQIGSGERAGFVHWARGRVPAENVLEVPRELVPSRDAGGRPGNLPLERASFIGRERALDAARTLLAGNRLVTLTGTGGTGKSRLAVRLAVELAGDFPDGIWLVNLASLHEPTLVPQAVASTLGIRAEAGLSLEVTLLARLRDRHLLLLLDNCEHLVAVCARLADALLHVAPGLHFLATSREPLSIAGEATFSVPPLGVPGPDPATTIEEMSRSEAVRLFVERGSAVRPGFELARSNGSAVSHICRRLDGIPLAIELAAARIRVLTVEQIAERLDDRFGLLTGRSRTDLPVSSPKRCRPRSTGATSC